MLTTTALYSFYVISFIQLVYLCTVSDSQATRPGAILKHKDGKL